MAASVTQELDLNDGLSCLQEIQAMQGLRPRGFLVCCFLFLHILKVSFSVGRANEPTHEAQI